MLTTTIRIRSTLKHKLASLHSLQICAGFFPTFLSMMISLVGQHGKDMALRFSKTRLLGRTVTVMYADEYKGSCVSRIINLVREVRHENVCVQCSLHCQNLHGLGRQKNHGEGMRRDATYPALYIVDECRVQNRQPQTKGISTLPSRPSRKALRSTWESNIPRKSEWHKRILWQLLIE